MLRGESFPTREKEKEGEGEREEWRGLGSRFPFPNSIREIVLTRTDGIYKTRAECDRSQ